MSWTVFVDHLSCWQCVLTVQLCLTQSSQKRLAENFLLITTVKPKSKHWPTPMMVPVFPINTLSEMHTKSRKI